MSPTSVLIQSLSPLVGMNIRAVHVPPLTDSEDVTGPGTMIAPSFATATVHEILGKREEVLDGTNAGLLRTQMQINLWHYDYEVAALAREDVRDFLLFNTPITLNGVNHQIDTELYDGDRELHQLITRLIVCFYR